MIQLEQVATASRDLVQRSGRRAKADCLAALLRDCSDDEIGVVARWMTGEPARQALGLGPAQVAAAQHAVQPSSQPRLGVLEVAAELAALGAIGGPGSKARRGELLGQLLARATQREQQFLARLMLGELRQGALLGLMVEGLALAFNLPLPSIQRALMLTGDIGQVATIARAQGHQGLAAVQLQLFHPVQPMLAQPAADLTEALGSCAAPLLELKLDGARVQVHKQGDEVRVYSRQGNEVTAAVPDLTEPVAALPVSDLVLDGETLTLSEDGRPRPFQTTMRRFGRHTDDPALRAQLPLTTFYFDCLRLSGETLIDAGTLYRRQALADCLPPDWLMPMQRGATQQQAEAFLAKSLAAGHEGLMAKAPEAPYIAGGRGRHWLKIKQAHTLDLVVLAAEWGSGRRQGWLSNLHLGARAGNGFVMLGKTFKGLTDRLLAWQTEQLLAREVARDGPIVQVRPELVVEIAFNEIQRSQQYPGGLALRFARVRRYRDDKSPDQADSIDSVRALFERQVAYMHAALPNQT